MVLHQLYEASAFAALKTLRGLHQQAVQASAFAALKVLHQLYEYWMEAPLNAMKSQEVKLNKASLDNSAKLVVTHRTEANDAAAPYTDFVDKRFAFASTIDLRVAPRALMRRKAPDLMLMRYPRAWDPMGPREDMPFAWEIPLVKVPEDVMKMSKALEFGDIQF